MNVEKRIGNYTYKYDSSGEKLVGIFDHASQKTFACLPKKAGNREYICVENKDQPGDFILNEGELENRTVMLDETTGEPSVYGSDSI